MLKNFPVHFLFSKLFVIFLNRVNFEFWGFFWFRFLLFASWQLAFLCGIFVIPSVSGLMMK